MAFKFFANLYQCADCLQLFRVFPPADPSHIHHVCAATNKKPKQSESHVTDTCKHLGSATKNTLVIPGCRGGRFQTFECSKFSGKETLPFLTNTNRINSAKSQGFLTCGTCDSFVPLEQLSSSPTPAATPHK